MRRRSWMIQAALGWCVLCWLGLGLGLAQAGVIAPIDSVTCLPITGSAVTLTIKNLSGNDITDTWLPTPGQPVRLFFNGGTVARNNVSFVNITVNESSFHTSATGPRDRNPFLSPCATSAYPGNATNVPSTGTTSFALDFTLTWKSNPGVYELATTDWGGMAVLNVVVTGTNTGTYKFLIPKDSDVDGIPDIYEAKFGGSVTKDSDAENPPVFVAPVATALVGDGLAAFDEYRGFVIAGVLGGHVRTDPTQKDLFLHLVDTQCAYSSQSLLGGTLGSAPFDVNFPTDGTPLFDNLNSMIAGTQIHLLGFTAFADNPTTTTEWVDRFISYEDPNTFTFTGGINEAPADDRQINRNHVFGVPEPVGGSTIQKGIRAIECTDPGDFIPLTSTPILCTTGTQASCLLGFASFGSANKRDNAVINTLRIVQEVDRLIASCNSGAGALQLDDYRSVVTSNRNNIVSQYIRYILAMEIGHSSQLTPTALGSAGFHHLAGAGSVLDQQVQYVTSGTGAGCTQQTFRIPELFNDNDRSNSRVRN